MLNKIIIQGRITRDIELRKTQKGVSVCSFSIANEADYKNEQGERETKFFECVAWRQTAEFISKWFGKGRMVLIEGEMNYNDWTDKEGIKRRTTVIDVRNIHFCDSAKAQSSSAVDESGFVEEEDDGDLPF